jgi:dihydrodipicolinate synthase/N-acetylneuraminate lyase
VSVRYHQAVLVSCQMPWDERENLVEKTFREEIRVTLRRGFHDLYIFGTAGEGYAVDTARFRQAVRIFAEETLKPGVFPQVGVIGLSTANVNERVALAYDAGFRFFQISLPCWQAVNDRELMIFFRDVCGAFPDAQFLHYNLARTKRVLEASDYRRLADEIPNLVATKNTGTNHMTTAALMQQVPEIQHFFSETQFPVGCQFGECSLLSSFGHLFPARTQEFFQYGRNRQLEALQQLLKRYLIIIEDLLAPTRGRNWIDGAYDKMWVRLSGIDFPLRLLSPYESLPDDIVDAVRNVLQEKHADWMG